MYRLMYLLTRPYALPYRMHMEEDEIWPPISHYSGIFHMLSASRPVTGQNRCSAICSSQWKSPAMGCAGACLRLNLILSVRPLRDSGYWDERERQKAGSAEGKLRQTASGFVFSE